MSHSTAATAFLVTYCIGLGIYLERKDVPRQLIARARVALDNEARRTARVLTDEIHARHQELATVPEPGRR